MDEEQKKVWTMNEITTLNKVYCTDCKHYNSERMECLCSENTVTQSTWLRVEQQSVEHPKELNRNNDCKWFNIRMYK